MILRTLKWRQEQGAGGLAEGDFPPGILERGTLFARSARHSSIMRTYQHIWLQRLPMKQDHPTLSSRNRDRDGRKLLVFCVGKHIKGTEKMEDMKKFFVYYLERLAR